MFTFTLSSVDNPTPLKELLRKLKFSLTLRRKLKQSPNAILVNAKTVPWQTILQPGDTLTINWPDTCQITPLPVPLNIIYEDEHLLVVDKPASFLVHPTTEISRPSLANAVIHYFRSQNILCGFHPVHRLDHNTSGLIMIAKNPYIQHLFSAGSEFKINRRYLAVIQGILSPSAGVIDAPIGRSPHSIIERMVRADGQAAITNYETVAIHGQYSIIKLHLSTGRTHQIRVHLAFKGHPILGDDLYGGSTEKISRQALHAAQMSFIHPLSDKLINLSSDLPEDIALLIKNLGFDNLSLP